MIERLHRFLTWQTDFQEILCIKHARYLQYNTTLQFRPAEAEQDFT